MAKLGSVKVGDLVSFDESDKKKFFCVVTRIEVPSEDDDWDLQEEGNHIWGYWYSNPNKKDEDEQYMGESELTIETPRKWKERVKE